MTGVRSRGTLLAIAAGVALTASVWRAPGVQAAGPQAPKPAAADVSQERALITRYCVSCHNEKVKTQGLALDSLNPDDVSVGTAAWEKVIRKLRTRAMPPVGLPRPDDATYEAVASALEHAIDQRAAAAPNPGRTETFHRLNRAEYRNVIRDLLDVDMDVSGLLPADDASNGFDNMGGLNVSSTLLESYLAAARTVSGMAVATRDVAPAAEVYRVRSDFSQRSRVDGLPIGTRGGTLFEHPFPLDAEYQIEVDLARAAAGGRHLLELSLDGARVQLVNLTERPAEGLRWRLPVRAGRHEVAATFLVRTSAAAEGLFEPPMRRDSDDPGVSAVTITGPFNASGAIDTPSRRRVFACYPAKATAEAACARQILNRLARRAYRRPVNEADVRLLWGFYESGQAEGGFEVGIERAIRRMLVSPEFLFRIERDRADGPAVYRDQ